ncbi:hypothetical protein PGT21_023328 [Puccinia graminis f. sp. tritici]|uniref:Uncharacterized protein n=1 Tax=Puccinia graminis f. sp. tritici TaxID=56615 RepID=A0A5B0LWJ1_PUCGR|nr:hypothetical protein PGT21_023328 [Puccinia graminis f. sp. tritici]KAA1137330.1 hypothetical protein PGTUg99_010633 [Puccinia graminis f. sp. tritici]
MKWTFLAAAISIFIPRTWGLSVIVSHGGTNFYVFDRNFAKDDKANLSELIEIKKVIPGYYYNQLLLKNISNNNIQIINAYFQTCNLTPNNRVFVPWHGMASKIIATTNSQVTLDEDLHRTLVDKAYVIN